MPDVFLLCQVNKNCEAERNIQGQLRLSRKRRQAAGFPVGRGSCMEPVFMNYSLSIFFSGESSRHSVDNIFM